MTLKKKDDTLIIVQTIKEETIKDLLHFDDDSAFLLDKFGIKNSNISTIVDSLTKLISNNIKAELTEYVEKMVNHDFSGDK